MILSKKPMTKVLISLRRCAGWSAPLLFANIEDRFSHVEAQIIVLCIPVFYKFCLFGLILYVSVNIK